MLQRALAFALTLMTAGVWLSSETARAQSRQGQSPWLRAESQHFEIHYLAGLAPELDRVVRSAERAYGRISAHLNFVLATKHPSLSERTHRPRVDRTYDSVFDLTPAEFDAAFRQYTERRFRPVVR